MKKESIIVWAVIVLAAAACFIFLIGLHACHGADMAPAVKDGDLLILYKQGALHRGDVVIYKDLEGRRQVARIFGLEGNDLELCLDAAPEEMIRAEKSQIIGKAVFLFRIRGI